jgi:hypothetical protein
MLNNTRITDNGLKTVKVLTKIRGLGLDETEVTDRGLEHLKALPKLRTVSVKGTKVTDQGVKKLQLALPGVKVLRGEKRDRSNLLDDY